MLRAHAEALRSVADLQLSDDARTAEHEINNVAHSFRRFATRSLVANSSKPGSGWAWIRYCNSIISSARLARITLCVTESAPTRWWERKHSGVGCNR